MTSLLRIEQDNRIQELNIAMNIDDGMNIVSSDGTIIKLHDSEGIKNGASLIYRYDMVDCPSCTQHLNVLIKKTIQKYNLQNDIIVIGNYSNHNDIRSNVNFWGTKYVYGIGRNSKDSQLAITKSFFCIVNNGGKIKDIYIPDFYLYQEIDSYLSAYEKNIHNKR